MKAHVFSECIRAGKRFVAFYVTRVDSKCKIISEGN